MISNGRPGIIRLDGAWSEARGSAARARSGGRRAVAAGPVSRSRHRRDHPQRARAGAARVGRSLQGRLRLPVHRPREGERHHLRPPHRGRRRHRLQAGALRPRQRRRGRRRRRRRPARHLFHEPDRRQPAVEEPRRRPVRGHHEGRRRRARRPHQRDRVVRGRGQRRRRGPVRDDGARRQRAVRERRARPVPRRLESGRRRLRRPLVGRGVLRLRQRRPPGPVRLQRRALHDRRAGDEAARSSARADAFDGHLHAGSVRDRDPLQEPRRPAVPRRHEGHGPRERRLERRCQRGGPERRRLSGSLRPEHAGVQSLLREPGRQDVRRQDAAGVSADVVGRDGHQVLRLRQRRPSRSARHRHALGHEPGRRARAREAQVADGVDDRVPAGRRHEVHLRQLVLPQPRRVEDGGDLGPRGRRELLALGAERRRPERRRLAGRLHRVVHGLPAPVRDQLAAAEQPRRDVPRQRVHPGDRAPARRADAHAVVRRRLLAAGVGLDRALQGTIGEDHGDGAARHPVVGHLRSRPGRRSRSRHQRLQLRAAGAGQQPRAAPRRCTGWASR